MHRKVFLLHYFDRKEFEFFSKFRSQNLTEPEKQNSQSILNLNRQAHPALASRDSNSVLKPEKRPRSENNVFQKEKFFSISWFTKTSKDCNKTWETKGSASFHQNQTSNEKKTLRWVHHSMAKSAFSMFFFQLNKQILLHFGLFVGKKLVRTESSGRWSA